MTDELKCPNCGGGPVTWKCMCEPMWRPSASIADTAGAKPDAFAAFCEHYIDASDNVDREWLFRIVCKWSEWTATPPAPSVAEPSEDKPVVCSCPSDECDVRTLGLTGSYYLRKCADLRATKNGDGHAE